MNNQNEEVVILGLGYVGLTLSVIMAERGFKVYGIEINNEYVKSINKGKSHFYEKGIDKRLKSVIQKGSFRAYPKINQKKNKFQNFIITVGTPLDNKGNVRVDMIKRATNEISSSMVDDSIVILRSTVKVGTTSEIIKPILEKSNKKFKLAFCPERTLEGDALAELEKLPQIISGIDKRSLVRAESIFQKITSTIVKVSNVETAEMIKLVDNTSRDLMFAYSNEIAKLSDMLGSNMSEVVTAGKKDYPRTNIPMPGPVGGPCLSKDAYILNESSKRVNLIPQIVMNGRRLNESQPSHVIKQIKKISLNKKWDKKLKISILGLAFKGIPETDDLRGTMAIPLIKAIKKEYPNSRIYGYDQFVSESKIKKLGIKYNNSIRSAMKDASLVIIANNHPEFQKFNVSENTYLMKHHSIVYDFWNTMDYNQTNFAEHVHYFCLGNFKLCLAMLEKNNQT